MGQTNGIKRVKRAQDISETPESRVYSAPKGREREKKLYLKR
jgi:hypothetical protein